MATPATKNDVKNTTDKLDKISKLLVDNSTLLLQLTEEIKELRKSQQFLSEQYEDMKQRLHSKDEEIKVLQAENQDLKLHVRKLEAVTSQTHEEVNDLEQYSRRECLEFQGLAWSKNENTDDLILHVSKMDGVDLKAEEIIVSTDCLLPQIKTRNLASLRGSAPGRPETRYSAKDIGCALTTRPTLKDAYSSMKA